MLHDSSTDNTIPLTVLHLSLSEFCLKKKSLDELINILSKAEERSDPNFIVDPRFEHQDRHNLESTIKFTADP